MTLRQEFEKQFDHLSALERLFAMRDIDYIIWLENKINNINATK
jgi:hypothetical protein